MIFIKNQRWYFGLVNGDKCLVAQKGESVFDKFVVQLIYGRKAYHIYTCFDNRIHFFNYMKQLRRRERTFSEVIHSRKPRKLYFDLDDTVDIEDTLEHLYEAIYNVFMDQGIEIDPRYDILQYSSHGKDKKSYHIVVNNYFFLNADAMSIFAHDIYNEIPFELREALDMGVYSGTRHLRTLYSTKHGESRYKKLDRTFAFRGEMIEKDQADKLTELLDSSITYVDDCEPIYVDIPEKELLTGEIPMEDVDEIINMFCDKLEIDDFDRTFKIRSIDGAFISFQRLRKSYCSICERVHEGENPFLFLAGESIYYKCRRSEEKIYIGEIELSTSQQPSSILFQDEDEEEEDVESYVSPIDELTLLSLSN